MMTAGEYFDGARFQKHAKPTTPMAPVDVLAELAAKKAERATRLRRATHLIKVGSVRQDDRDAWVAANPSEAQRLRFQPNEIDRIIVKASRDSDLALNAEIGRLETQVAQWPSDLAKMRKAERIADYMNTPAAAEGRERYERLKKKRDELLDENPRGVDLTPRERDQREKLSRDLMQAWAIGHEPPSDYGQGHGDDLFPMRGLAS